MKISKEIKTGILGLIVITAVIALINYAKKSNFFDRDSLIFAVFNSASGIDKDNLVLINGLPVGTVAKLQAADKNLTGVTITLKLQQDLKIPDNSIAHIVPSTLGTPAIVIEKGNSKTYLSSKDTIRTANNNDNKIKEQIKPLEEKINTVTQSLSAILKSYNTKLDSNKQQEIRRQIAVLNKQMSDFRTQLQHFNQEPIQSLEGFVNTTKEYDRKSQSINNMLLNANEQTNELAQMNLERKLDTANKQLRSLRSDLNNLNNGPIGSLINNKNAYNNLVNQLQQTEILLDDIRVHPKRHFNVSVLGKSDNATKKTEPDSLKVPIKK
ncbi:MAG: MlaD family protein [Niabella sp.]